MDVAAVLDPPLDNFLNLNREIFREDIESPKLIPLDTVFKRLPCQETRALLKYRNCLIHGFT